MNRFFYIFAFAITTTFGTTAQSADTTFAIDISESSRGDYDWDANQAIKAGAEAASLTIYWDDADKGGRYAPDFDWPAVANAYYPPKNLGIILSLPVIDTVTDRRPSDLKRLRWDDPKVIARFETYVTEVLSRMTGTDLVAIGIGSEVDGFLRGTSDWEEFQGFFVAAKDIVHRIRPGVPVGYSVTWQGMEGRNIARAAAINAHADAVFINYYHLDSRFRVLPPADIVGELDAMINMANGKPVFILETGYPSGGCGSSEELQREYFQHLVTAWEQRKRAVPLINLAWLHDIPESTLKEYGQYYGLRNNKCFLSYLGTLGLRTQDGQNKLAFDWLVNR